MLLIGTGGEPLTVGGDNEALLREGIFTGAVRASAFGATDGEGTILAAERDFGGGDISELARGVFIEEGGAFLEKVTLGFTGGFLR